MVVRGAVVGLCALALGGCITIKASNQDAKPKVIEGDQLALAKVLKADGGYFSAESSVKGDTAYWSDQCQGFSDPIRNEGHGFIVSAAIDHPAVRRWNAGTVQYLPILVLSFQKDQKRVCQTDIADITRLIPLSVWDGGKIALNLRYVETRAGSVDFSKIASLTKNIVGAINPTAGVVLTAANAIISENQRELNELIARSVNTETQVTFTAHTIGREEIEKGMIVVDFPIKVEDEKGARHPFITVTLQLSLRRSFFVNASTHRGAPDLEPDLSNFDKNRILVKTQLGVAGAEGREPREIYTHFATPFQDGREPFRNAHTPEALFKTCKEFNQKIATLEATPRDKAYIKWAYLKENLDFGRYDEMTEIRECLSDSERKWVRAAGLELPENLPIRNPGNDLPYDCRVSSNECAKAFNRRLFGPVPRGLEAHFSKQINVSNSSNLALDGFTGQLAASRVAEILDRSFPVSRNGCWHRGAVGNAYIFYGLPTVSNVDVPVRAIAYFGQDRLIHRLEFERPDVSDINAACASEHQREFQTAVSTALTS